jgi:hypothetical protein
MTSLAANPIESPSWKISAGAEGIAAAQFARCGFDVSLQYGANKPAYDMVVTRGGSLLKIEVRGSQDGTWNLTQSYIKRAAEFSGKKADFHGAIELWLDHYGARTVCCLVQFLGVGLDELPRIYLATPKDVATKLRESAAGRGDSVLYEGNKWASPILGSETTECLPESWCFSQQRIQELLGGQAPASSPIPVRRKVESPSGVWSTLDHISPASQMGIAVNA